MITLTVSGLNEEQLERVYCSLGAAGVPHEALQVIPHINGTQGIAVTGREELTKLALIVTGADFLA